MKFISNIPDAFGQTLLDYLNGKEVVQVVERDDGFLSVDTNSLGSYFSDYRNWPAVEKAAIKFAHGRVLDVGCGAGRHALYLQAKGLDVLPIDTSPFAVKVSKLRGVKKAKVLAVEKIHQLRQTNFDTILMLGHNLGLLGGFQKGRRLLRNLYRLTSPASFIIATTRNPYQTTTPGHKAYHRWNLRRGRMPGQVRIRVRHGKLISPWFDYLFISQEELQQLLQGTGWQIKKLISQKNDPSYAVILEKDKRVAASK